MHMNNTRRKRFSSIVGPQFRDLEKNTQTISVLGDDGIAEKAYKDLQEYLCSRKKLYEDPDFDVNSVEQVLGKNPDVHKNVTEWKRPAQICRPPLQPLFYKDGASRFDIVQGALGDCWFLAAVASIAKYEKLVHHVAPPDQGFTTKENYCGLFRFRFWHDGMWKQVLVDDRLPVRGDRLVFMSSSAGDEFWTALLEKAYAKLMGSYTVIDGGIAHEALKDLTGGFALFYEGLQDEPNLYKELMRANQRHSLMTCAVITAKPEPTLPSKHAYTISDVQLVKVKGLDGKQSEVQLLRIRNPWGNNKEWTGPWHDSSAEWNNVSPEDKKRIGLENKVDGEFWMEFSSFVRVVDAVDICFLTPEEGVFSSDKLQWEMKEIHGAWKADISAGGPPVDPKKFNTNPKFQLSVKDADADGVGTVFLSLMKKSFRTKTQIANKAHLQLHVYKLGPKADIDKLDEKFFEETNPIDQTMDIYEWARREISTVLKLTPGNYVVVPCTDVYNYQSEFILRIVTEKANNSTKQVNDQTIIDLKLVNESVLLSLKDKMQLLEEKIKNEFQLQTKCQNMADAGILKAILDNANHSSNATSCPEGFDMDFVRFVAIQCSGNKCGKLTFDETRQLFMQIQEIELTFSKHDVNKNGSASLQELRNMLTALNLKVSDRVLQAAAVRFGNENGEISIHNFIAVCIRLITLYKDFPDVKDKNELLVSTMVF